jgi:triose/dihydroxyacetone kinase / FAD-AMP lyase (cyclizing)
MSSKSFTNAENNVQQALASISRLSNGARCLVKGHKSVVRSDYATQANKKVAIIGGGGAGHEPAQTSFVGFRMLTIAVSGEVFASPSVNAILNAILLVTGDKGCLLIVLNYTGDRLNFSLAAERAKAMGKKVEIVLVADDITIDIPKKRRGITGVVLINKIAGFYAEQGHSLEEIKYKCEQAALGLMSVTFSNAAADSIFGSEVIQIDPQVARGIHNEAGEKYVYKTRNLAKEAVDKVIEYFVPIIDHNCEYAVMVNNLGGISPLEMAIITEEVLNSAISDRIKIVIGPGCFCTSLNMPGFSISLLALTSEIESALMSAVDSPAWIPPIRPMAAPQLIEPSYIDTRHYTPSKNPKNHSIITQGCEAIISSKDQLNSLDSYGGDGDAGETLSLAATSIKEALDTLPLDHLDYLLVAIGEILSEKVGGSSGVLFSILFTNAGITLQNHETDSLADALMKGAQALMKYVGSQVGDRSMLDALIPALETLEQQGTFQIAAEAARKGADKTATMIAKVGRAQNVPPKIYQGYNDAGAEAIALIFERLAVSF